jgi:hypothetical protein
MAHRWAVARPWGRTDVPRATRVLAYPVVTQNRSDIGHMCSNMSCSMVIHLLLYRLDGA